MCGIAGILDLKQRPVDAAILRRMCDALRHRGPDGEGFFMEGPVGLGHRRLSIIDLSSGGQPMGNEDGSIQVVFNGEIYNFQELRRQLELRGHRFTTHSDTEVIPHAYEEYGAACVRCFRGMFAFALWDRSRQTLLLARDHVGKKPLVYAEVDGQFVFASELQGLLKHPGVRREVDPIGLDEYLTYGYIPAPRTGFQGVRKLPPAHYLEITLRGEGAALADLCQERYWRLEYGPKQQLREEEAVEALEEQLTEAVRLRLIADVPLGALLSGGLDSSIVVALMSRLSSRPVKTFSIGFKEQEYNELPYARLVAQRYSTEHHELIVRAQNLDVIPKLVRHYGEPYADWSAVPTHAVAQMTRQHVTVALNGDGGDECLAGYERYLGSAVAERYLRLPQLVRAGVIEPLATLIPQRLSQRSRLRQAQKVLRAAALPFAHRYQRWLTFFTPERKRELYTPALAAAVGDHAGHAWLLGIIDARVLDTGVGLDALLGTDVDSYLPFDLLVKMDIAGMANSLEARSSFLDYKVMEFCARLPTNLKQRRTTLKYLGKRLARCLLPREIICRRKMGFGMPIAAWIRGAMRPLLEDALFSAHAQKRGYFRPAALRELAEAHWDGRQDNSFQLWSLLMLELWHREFLD